MSKSRLEKFLYALYSLDSSDLPTPLSRIEELYKCLVTGEEAPTFKPLSRVEKYLMAILGVYDADELPNPLSIVEVLLYKLATGDDNLDDFKSFLSEHEELLAEIIRNGGAGGNIDIEYVLYSLSTEFNTLYNTAEKPVKSAILKGNTLVNLLSISNINIETSNSYYVNYVHNLDTTKTYILKYRINQIPELTDVTDSGRLLKFEWYSDSVISGYSDIYVKDITVGINNFIIINPFSNEVTKTKFCVWCPNYVSGNLDMDIMLIEYQKGMENWDIPYFEGMRSVKMPVLTTTNGEPEFIEVDGEQVPNEAFKSNTLTVNEEVELRGVGHVYDELNLETGELTERIGEIVLDGSENWRNATTTGAVRFSINLENSTTDNKRSPIISDYFPYVSSGHIYPGAFVYGNMLYVYLEETTTLEEFITWLGINKPSVQYQLATESIKTVDLSVVDQDGNNTKLSTFDDITHVSLSSEGLIPEAELEVATKNEEVLNTMSLEMDDISTTQTALEETSNAQSENVDATMIATTEIYEGLL